VDERGYIVSPEGWGYYGIPRVFLRGKGFWSARGANFVDERGNIVSYSYSDMAQCKLTR